MTQLFDPVTEDAVSVCVDHLPLSIRVDAAEWCMKNFGYDNVNLWCNKNDKPHFWFKSEKDAMWFTLKWSK